MYVSSERLRSLARAFAARPCDKYQISGTFYSAAKPKNANAILLCSFIAALLAPIGTIGTIFTASINLSESCTLQVVLFL